MTDLEITKLCAEALDIPLDIDGIPNVVSVTDPNAPFLLNRVPWNPLHDDAQAMALVKKLQLFIMPEHEGLAWHVSDKKDNEKFGVGDDDLNRAICECVAKMQKDK